MYECQPSSSSSKAAFIQEETRCDVAAMKTKRLQEKTVDDAKVALCLVECLVWLHLFPVCGSGAWGRHWFGSVSFPVCLSVGVGRGEGTGVEGAVVLQRPNGDEWIV